jgi:Tfp pilus assembly protein PilE
MINLMRKNYKGFTLIEILIITAIMGILTAIGVPIYQDYVISSIENQAKVNLQSIAFMQGDHRRESGQYLPCPKKTLGTTQIDKQFFGGQGDLSSSDYSYKMIGGCSGFIASALIFNSNAKCFKIDQNRIISSISCPKDESLAVAKTASISSSDPEAFANYKPCEESGEEQAGRQMGIWTVVDSDGAIVPYNQTQTNQSFFGFSCYLFDNSKPNSVKKLENQEGGPYRLYSSGTIASHGHKVVFGCGGSHVSWRGCRMPEGATYNFTTGIWSNSQGEKCEKGLSCR